MGKHTKPELTVQGDSCEAVAYAVVDQIPKAKNSPDISRRVARVAYGSCERYTKNGELRMGGPTLEEHAVKDVRVALGFWASLLISSLVRSIVVAVVQWYIKNKIKPTQQD